MFLFSVFSQHVMQFQNRPEDGNMTSCNDNRAVCDLASGWKHCAVFGVSRLGRLAVFADDELSVLG